MVDLSSLSSLASKALPSASVASLTSVASRLPSYEQAAKAALGSVTSDQIQGAIASAASGAKGAAAATWDAATTDTANTARESQGADAAASLVQHGFDPDSAADRQKMVAAVAGGLALIPGVGPELGAALEILFQVGNVVAGLLSKLWPPGCVHTGPEQTAQGILDAWASKGIKQLDPSDPQQLPPMPVGSFAELAMKALAASQADSYNCKSTMVPHAIVSALAAIWNRDATGPAVDVFVPCLPMWFEPGGEDSTSQVRMIGSGSKARFLFDTPAIGPFFSKLQMAHAFQPIASVPIEVQGAVTESLAGTPGILRLKGSTYAAAKYKPAPPPSLAPKTIVALHLSPAATRAAAAPAPAPAPAPGVSKAKVAAGSLLVAGLAIAAKLLL